MEHDNVGAGEMFFFIPHPILRPGSVVSSHSKDFKIEFIDFALWCQPNAENETLNLSNQVIVKKL